MRFVCNTYYLRRKGELQDYALRPFGDAGKGRAVVRHNRRVGVGLAAFGKLLRRVLRMRGGARGGGLLQSLQIQR